MRECGNARVSPGEKTGFNGSEYRTSTSTSNENHMLKYIPRMVKVFPQRQRPSRAYSARYPIAVVPARPSLDAATWLMFQITSELFASSTSSESISLLKQLYSSSPLLRAVIAG